MYLVKSGFIEPTRVRSLMSHRDNDEQVVSQFSRFADVVDPIRRLKTQTDSAFSDRRFLEERLRLSVMGLKVVAVGARTGRRTHQIATLGAKAITVVESSSGMRVIQSPVAPLHQSVEWTLLQHPVDSCSIDDADVVVSVGVLHHIPNYVGALRSIRSRLKPSGVCYLWVYRRPNNLGLFSFIKGIRWLAARLPDVVVSWIAGLLSKMVTRYGAFPRALGRKSPFYNYCREVNRTKSVIDQRHTIYDQLRPAFAPYFSALEFGDVCTPGGFQASEIEEDGEVGLIAWCGV